MELGQPLAYVAVPVPSQVDLVGERVAWRGSVNYRRLEGDVLGAFAALASASDERVLAFARSYGPLGLCADGLPLSHRPTPYGSKLSYGCRTERFRDYEGAETTDAWRHFASHAQAALNVAAELQDGRLGRKADWETLRRPLGHVQPAWEKLSGLAGERRTLAQVANALLMLGDVRLGLIWDHQSPLLELRGGLFGLLAAQLMARIAIVDGLYLCSGCGNAYAPIRKPREGQRRYCDACREAGVPWRHGMRDQRKKEAAR